VDVEPSREIAGAGDTLSGPEIAAQNREQQLRGELLAHRKAARAGDP
jgi:hypothetical protein